MSAFASVTARGLALIRPFPRARAFPILAAAALCFLSLAAPAQAQGGGGSSILPGGSARAPINIDAARLDFFDKESKLVYSGGVLARQGEATLKASTLTIFFARDAMRTTQAGAASDDQVRRMEAGGPVTVTSNQQVGTGDRGVYNRAENRLYLIGNPVLSQGPNIVRGGPDAQLIYDLNTGQARITGGRVQSVIVPRSGAAPGGR